MPQPENSGSPSRIRTCDTLINSQLRYRCAIGEYVKVPLIKSTARTKPRNPFAVFKYKDSLAPVQVLI